MAVDLGQRPSDADEQSEDQKPYDDVFWGMVKRGELGQPIDPDNPDGEKASSPEDLAAAEENAAAPPTLHDQVQSAFDAAQARDHGDRAFEPHVLGFLR